MSQHKLFRQDEAPLYEKSAYISDCGKYRYALGRYWNKKKPTVMFIMLNPSTADADQDDATIRRCREFAKSWGYGGFMVGNLFAFRSTDPKALLTQPDPVGPENIACLLAMACSASIVVCAWGNAPIVKKFRHSMPNYKPLRNITNLHYLRLNGFTPGHPLYLKKDTEPNKMSVDLQMIISLGHS